MCFILDWGNSSIAELVLLFYYNNLLLKLQSFICICCASDNDKILEWLLISSYHPGKRYIKESILDGLSFGRMMYPVLLEIIYYGICICCIYFLALWHVYNPCFGIALQKIHHSCFEGDNVNLLLELHWNCWITRALSMEKQWNRLIAFTLSIFFFC